MRPDEQIKKDVVDQLLLDTNVDAAQINVAVAKGAVTLTGTVPSYSAKQSAATDAWIVPDVVGVDNALVITPKNTTSLSTDGKIRQNTEKALENNHDIEAGDIKVSVEDGIVTLAGSVSAYWQKIKAEELAAGITGVIDIINKITVAPTEKIEDEALAQTIANTLDRHADVYIDDITVRVEDGVVTLAGTVPDKRAWQAAYDAARFTDGVVTVKDNLVINFTS